MKTLIALIMFFPLLSTAESIDPVTSHHVIFYMKARHSKIVSDPNLFYESLTPVRKHRMGVLKNIKIEILKESNSEAQLSALFANLFRAWPFINIPLALEGREPILAPYPHSILKRVVDVLVTIDFKKALTFEQKEAMKEIKEGLSKNYAFSVSATRKYVALKRQEVSDTDYRIAFLVPWKKGVDRIWSQEYWLGPHKDLAVSLLPPALKNYVIYQTNLNETGDGLFDDVYQGITIENVESAELIKSLAKEKGAWKASFKLAADEEGFIGHPTFIVFKPVSL